MDEEKDLTAAEQEEIGEEINSTETPAADEEEQKPKTRKERIAFPLYDLASVVDAADAV